MVTARARYLYRAAKYRWGSDRAELAFARRHLAAGDVALDLGAHKGAYLYWMQRWIGSGGRVYAFEPQPALAHYLERIRRGFNWTHVEVVNAAVSCASGEGMLAVPGDGAPGGCGISPGAHLVADDAGGRREPGARVRTVALDEFRVRWAGRRVGFIKCDVEGHELEVFRGALTLLTEDRPALLFECEARHRPGGSVAEVWAFLERLGYQGWFFDADRLRPVSEFSPDHHQARVGDRFWDARGYCNNFAFLPGTTARSGTLARTVHT